MMQIVTTKKISKSYPICAVQNLKNLSIKSVKTKDSLNKKPDYLLSLYAPLGLRSGGRSMSLRSPAGWWKKIFPRFFDQHLLRWIHGAFFSPKAFFT